MPHKRAKNSARSTTRQQLGSDLPPGHIGFEKEISKRASWVLNAEQVRKDFRAKRSRDDGADGPKGESGNTAGKPSKKRKRAAEPDAKTPHSILPGESLGHFNKRIEAEFKPAVRAAVKSSSATSRRATKTTSVKDTLPTSTAPPSSSSSRPANTNPTTSSVTKDVDPHARTPKTRKTEFESLPTQRRLNDIALAPPTLSRAARKAPAKGSGAGKEKGGLSMAQQKAMELEREVVVRRYREMKAQREADGGEGKR